MKSFRIDQEEVLSHDNIERSFKKPSRGKRDRPDVKEALDNLESEIAYVYEMMMNGEFVPRHHEPVIINEKNYLKVRRIIKPDFKYEQVVHHIEVQAIRGAVEHGMYEYVLGSVPGRGAHMGADAIERWIRNDPVNTKNVLKMDIYHFFESVNHRVLKRWLKKKIRDEYILEVLFLIIDAVENGLPLGFYTSQWFANFLLQPLDHFIKEELHVKYMTRYMDDIVCFGRNKKELHRVQEEIRKYIKREFGLSLKGNWQVFRFEYEAEEYSIMCNSLKDLENLQSDLEKKRIRHTCKMYHKKRRVFVKTASVKSKSEAFMSIINKYHAVCEVVVMKHGRPLDYMGFEFHRDYTIMRESIMLRLTKKALQVSKQEKINPRDAASLLSSMGWVRHTDTYGMYEKRIKPYVNIKKLKKIVSKHQRRLNASEKAKLEADRGNTDRETAGVGDRGDNGVSSQKH